MGGLEQGGPLEGGLGLPRALDLHQQEA